MSASASLRRGDALGAQRLAGAHLAAGALEQLLEIVLRLVARDDRPPHERGVDALVAHGRARCRRAGEAAQLDAQVEGRRGGACGPADGEGLGALDADVVGGPVVIADHAGKNGRGADHGDRDGGGDLERARADALGEFAAGDEPGRPAQAHCSTASRNSSASVGRAGSKRLTRPARRAASSRAWSSAPSCSSTSTPCSSRAMTFTAGT